VLHKQSLSHTSNAFQQWAHSHFRLLNLGDLCISYLAQGLRRKNSRNMKIETPEGKKKVYLPNRLISSRECQKWRVPKSDLPHLAQHVMFSHAYRGSLALFSTCYFSFITLLNILRPSASWTSPSMKFRVVNLIPKLLHAYWNRDRCLSRLPM
jgi:hypothetical protein